MAKEYKKIAVLYEGSRHYSREIMRGLSKFCHLKTGYILSRPFPSDLIPLEISTLSYLANLNPDGIIVPTSHKSLNKILALGIPTIVHILTNHKTNAVPQIIGDAAAIGQMTAEHLLSKGLSSFAYFGISDRETSYERCSGFFDRLLKAGFHGNVFQVSAAFLNKPLENIMANIVSWIRSLPKPVGIMAQSDELAQLIVSSCTNANIRIPFDVAVIGIDNDPIVCSFSDVPISSVELNHYHAGFKIAELMDKFISGKEKPYNQKVIVQPVEVVQRQSTDILAVDDPEVRKALEFIRNHAHEKISVSDVVAVTNLSPTALYQRFSKTIHQPIQSFITHSRICNIEKLIRETDMNISEIGRQFEYLEPENICH